MAGYMGKFPVIWYVCYANSTIFTRTPCVPCYNNAYYGIEGNPGVCGTIQVSPDITRVRTEEACYDVLVITLRRPLVSAAWIGKDEELLSDGIRVSGDRIFVSSGRCTACDIRFVEEGWDDRIRKLRTEAGSEHTALADLFPVDDDLGS